MRFGILAGPELVGQIIPLMQMPSLPCWVPVKRGGALSAGHSCFPFLLNHTATIWTRLSLHTELLRRPRLSLSRQAWPSEPRPLPSAPVPDPLCPNSPLLLLLRGPAGLFRSWTRHMQHAGVCVCVCVCSWRVSTHSQSKRACAAYASVLP